MSASKGHRFDGQRWYLSHGHVKNAQTPPPMQKGDLLLCGHTHVAADEECGDFRYINPGSVSIPKEDTDHGYIVFENGIFTRKML